MSESLCTISRGFAHVSPGTRQWGPSWKRRRPTKTGGDLGLARPWHTVQFHVAFAGNNFTAANAANVSNTFLFQNALQPADGVALAVEKAANAFQQIQIGGTIIAPAARPLHGLYLGKAGFPESQNMLGNIKLFCRFADRAECFR